jgi:hypothetical protein
MIREVATGGRGAAPATIGVLSGDVHHSYLAYARPADGAQPDSLIYQAVCSPFRHPLEVSQQRMIKVALSRPAVRLARALARRAHVSAPELEWRFAQQPWFGNSMASLTLAARSAHLTIEKTLPDWRNPTLAAVLERQLV